VFRRAHYRSGSGWFNGAVHRLADGMVGEI
jgi:hypothetical protein